MKSLTPADLKRRTALVEKIRAAETALNDAVVQYNEAVAAGWDALLPVIESYNEVVEEGRGFAEDMAAALSEHFDEKSERWQESAAGESFAAWQSAWTDMAFETLDVEDPVALEIEIESVADALEGGPASVDEA